MSVQSEIARISGNVAAALAAIAEKGVSVPDGSTSDALASLIAAIEAGGEGGGNHKTGTVVPATNSDRIVIEHNCGFLPNYFALTASRSDVRNAANYTTSALIFALVFCKDITDTSTYISAVVREQSSGAYGSAGSNGDYVLTGSSGGSNCAFNSMTETKIDCVSRISSSKVSVIAGVEYRWYAGVI